MNDLLGICMKLSNHQVSSTMSEQQSRLVTRFHPSDTTIRHPASWFLLVLAGFSLISSSGCMSSKSSDAIADALAYAIVTQMVAPQVELSISTMAFQKQHGRWPSDYAELCSFASATGSALTNYTKVDFTQKVDGSLEVYAMARNMTNRMTLNLTDMKKNGNQPPPSP